MPNAAGSGSGWAKKASVNSPCHIVTAMNAAKQMFSKTFDVLR